MSKEDAILRALPGTAKHIRNKTGLPQATVSKLLAKLKQRNLAYHSSWEYVPGVMSAMIYAAGPLPAGYRVPERPRSDHARLRWSKPMRLALAPEMGHKPALPTRAEWDEECRTDHLFTTGKVDELPRLPLLAEVWMTPVDYEPSDERSTEPDSSD